MSGYKKTGNRTGYLGAIQISKDIAAVTLANEIQSTVESFKGMTDEIPNLEDGTIVNVEGSEVLLSSYGVRIKRASPIPLTQAISAKTMVFEPITSSKDSGYRIYTKSGKQIGWAIGKDVLMDYSAFDPHQIGVNSISDDFNPEENDIVDITELL